MGAFYLHHLHLSTPVTVLLVMTVMMLARLVNPYFVAASLQGRRYPDLAALLLFVSLLLQDGHAQPTV